MLPEIFTKLSSGDSNGQPGLARFETVANSQMENDASDFQLEARSYDHGRLVAPKRLVPDLMFLRVSRHSAASVELVPRAAASFGGPRSRRKYRGL